MPPGRLHIVCSSFDSPLRRMAPALAERRWQFFGPARPGGRLVSRPRQPGICSGWSMHEIFPRAPTGPPELISPALFGELSRRFPSELATHSLWPLRNGLVGSSRM